MRYFFQISYRGTAYHGWQSQPNAVGIQQIVEKVMTTVLQEKMNIQGSGRTDAGVHCVKQYFHCDIEKTFNTERLIIQLNSYLPKDIAIHHIYKVTPDANARYDAYERTYEYHITRIKDPLKTGLAFHYFKQADLPTMNKAAALITGTHDFQCFSKVHTDVNHFVCELKDVRWNQKKDLLVFTITGNRFLRGMVRAIVGTLLEVGSGKISLKEFQDILKSKDRKKAGMNAPPEGLFLMEVKYPRSIFLRE